MAPPASEVTDRDVLAQQVVTAEVAAPRERLLFSEDLEVTRYPDFKPPIASQFYQYWYGKHIALEIESERREEQLYSVLHSKGINVNSGNSNSLNDPVPNTINGSSLWKKSSGETQSIIAKKSVPDIQEETASSTDIQPLSVDMPLQSLNLFPKAKSQCDVGEKIRSALRVLVEELNSAVFNYLHSEPRAARTLGLVMGDNHTEDRRAWKMAVTPCSAENILKDVFVDRNLIGCYKEEPPPSSTKASSRASIRARRKKPAMPGVDMSSLATPRELHLRYKRSLLKKWTTTHNDQRSNRCRKKANIPSCEFNTASSSSSSPNKRRSVPESLQMDKQFESDLENQCSIEEPQQTKQSTLHHSSHHSSTTISTGDPSDSTQSPLSSSQPKSKESGSKSPNIRQSKKGRASNQREGTLNGRSGTGEEAGDGLLPDNRNQDSKSETASSQTEIKKEETRVALEQELPMCLSQKLPSSASLKIPPDKAVNKQRSQVSSNELPLSSPGGPGIAAQSQTPPATLCTEAAGQPKVKPHHNTATIVEVTQDPPSTIHDEAADNQLLFSFNVEPTPDIQALHAAEISSGVLPEAEWINESAAKNSASVTTLAVTLREHAPDLEFSVTPAVQLSDEKPPSDEPSDIQAASGEINEVIASNKPVPITKSPSSEGLVGAPAFSTIDPEVLPAVGQSTAALDNYSLLEFLGGESVDEFSPLLFNSSAGDDGFLSPQPTCQVPAKEVVVNDGGEIYQHPIEEAGHPEPDNTQMVISRPTLPANHTLENQALPHVMASLPLLPYITHGGRIVSALCDVWGFTAFVDVDVPESMRECNL